MVRALRNNFANAWGQGPGPSSLFGRPTVLVVDDDQEFLFITREMLELHGFTPLTATTGLQGVEVFRRHAEEIDLVLVDLARPLKEGLVVAQSIRNINPHVPILISSGPDDEPAGPELQWSGLAGHIKKPYSFNQLITQMKRIIGAASADWGAYTDY